MKNKIIALVPMRHESERVPGKNYRLFNGRPLYHYIVRSLLKCRFISDILIDTDSPFILEDAEKHFPSVHLIERPDHLRGGDIPMNAILLYDVTQIDGDWYFQTHSTNPLLRSETITSAIQQGALFNYSGPDLVASPTFTIDPVGGGVEEAVGSSAGAATVNGIATADFESVGSSAGVAVVDGIPERLLYLGHRKDIAYGGVGRIQ